jgi:hypothetical protein
MSYAILTIVIYVGATIFPFSVAGNGLEIGNDIISLFK